MLLTFWTTFWTNTIWFIILFLTSIITNIIVLCKTSNTKFAIAFLFSIIGLSFVFEAILVLGFNAYSYYPKIFKDSYLDIIFGNYFSQISVSSTALFLTIFNLPYIWYCIFGLIYFLTDAFFVKLGVYKHLWFKSIYTFIGFIIFSLLVKKWYEKAQNSTNKFISFISLYCSVASFSTFTIFLGQRLLGIQLLQSKIFFTDINKNNTSSGFIYQIIVLNYLIILYKSRSNRIIKTIAFTCLFFVQYLAYYAGYIYIHRGLFFIVTSLDLFGCYILIAIFNYLFSKQTTT